MVCLLMLCTEYPQLRLSAARLQAPAAMLATVRSGVDGRRPRCSISPVAETVSQGTFVRRIRRAVNRRMHPPGDREGYFEALAPSYDDWWTGTGRMANTENLRPGWRAEVDALFSQISAFEPARTLDVACGTGYLTCRLPGLVVGLDQSQKMLELACRQAPDAIFVHGDALTLPFPDGSFGRLFASHIYGHLTPAERRRFVEEARRVAGELVLVDTAGKEDTAAGAVQLRGLVDGSRWKVFKQPFTPARMLAELGGGEVLLDGAHFVMVRSPAR
jgi:SAM-dependent methyltransferase